MPFCACFYSTLFRTSQARKIYSHGTSRKHSVPLLLLELCLVATCSILSPSRWLRPTAGDHLDEAQLQNVFVLVLGLQLSKSLFRHSPFLSVLAHTAPCTKSKALRIGEAPTETSGDPGIPWSRPDSLQSLLVTGSTKVLYLCKRSSKKREEC